MAVLQKNHRTVSLSVALCGGLMITASALGLIRGVTAEPIKEAPLPAVSKPKQDPNPTTVSFPAAVPAPAPAMPEIPALPAAPTIPGVPAAPGPETPSPTLLAVPSLPDVPEVPAVNPPVIPAPAATTPTTPTPTVPALPAVPPALPEVPAIPPVLPTVPELTSPVVPVAAPTKVPAIPVMIPPVHPKAPEVAPIPAAVPNEVAPKPKTLGNESAPAPVPVSNESAAKPTISVPSLTPTPESVSVPLPPVIKPSQPTEPAKSDFNLRLNPAESTLNPGNTAPGGSTEGSAPRIVPPAYNGTTPTSTIAGDTIMKLPLRQTLLSAAFGVALATATPVAPVAAAEPVKETPKSNDAEVAALKTQVEKLQKELESVKVLQNVLDESVLGRKDGKVYVPTDKGVLKMLAELEKTTKAIDERLKTLEEKMNKTTAGASPIGNTPKTTPKPIAAGKSTLKLVNEYAINVSLIVNGVSHQLEPNQTKELEIPAGNFNYELIGASDVKKSSTIREGETVTLRIR